MASYREIEVSKIFDNTPISASGYVVSNAVDLGDYVQEGNFSLHLEVSSTGATVDASYQISNNNKTFITPYGASDIVNDFGQKSGLSKDGKDIIPFDVIFARYLKIKILEIGGVGTTVTAYLAIQ